MSFVVPELSLRSTYRQDASSRKPQVGVLHARDRVSAPLSAQLTLLLRRHARSRLQTGLQRWTFLLGLSQSGLRLQNARSGQRAPLSARQMPALCSPWIMKSLMIRWKTVPARASQRQRSAAVTQLAQPHLRIGLRT